MPIFNAIRESYGVRLSELRLFYRPKQDRAKFTLYDLYKVKYLFVQLSHHTAYFKDSESACCNVGS